MVLDEEFLILYSLISIFLFFKITFCPQNEGGGFGLKMSHFILEFSNQQLFHFVGVFFEIIFCPKKWVCSMEAGFGRQTLRLPFNMFI